MAKTTKAKSAKHGAAKTSPAKSATKRNPLMSVVPDTAVEMSANAALIARREAAVVRGVALASPPFFARGGKAELGGGGGDPYVCVFLLY